MSRASLSYCGFLSSTLFFSSPASPPRARSLRLHPASSLSAALSARRRHRAHRLLWFVALEGALPWTRGLLPAGIRPAHLPMPMTLHAPQVHQGASSRPAPHTVPLPSSLSVFWSIWLTSHHQISHHCSHTVSESSRDRTCQSQAAVNQLLQPHQPLPLDPIYGPIHCGDSLHRPTKLRHTHTLALAHQQRQQVKSKQHTLTLTWCHTHKQSVWPLGACGEGQGFRGCTWVGICSSVVPLFPRGDPMSWAEAQRVIVLSISKATDTEGSSLSGLVCVSAKRVPCIKYSCKRLFMFIMY